ncbi:MAG TPA: flagellar export protein FliJ [Bacillota bacterium]
MKFRFEPLLNLRKHHEDDCKYRLKKEEVVLLSIQRELAAVDRRTAQEAEYLKKVGTGRIDPFLLSSGSRFLSYLRQKRIEIDEARALQERQVAIAREDLISARKARKTMERLKENFMEQQNKSALYREQKTLDEIGISLVHLGKR